MLVTTRRVSAVRPADHCHGSVDVSWLEARFRFASTLSVLHACCSVPVRALELRSSAVSFTRVLHWTGSVPARLFCPKAMDCGSAQERGGGQPVSQSSQCEAHAAHLALTVREVTELH